MWCLPWVLFPQELRTPTKNRMVSEKQSPIHGVVMGATQRSYLMRDNQASPQHLQRSAAIGRRQPQRLAGQ